MEIGTTDAEISALNRAILLKVSHNLVHNGCRNSEAVAGIGASLRVEHGVDTYEFAVSGHECAAGVTTVDGCVGLNEALHTVGADRACLG